MKMKMLIPAMILTAGLLGVVSDVNAGNEEPVQYMPAAVYLENEKLTFPSGLYVFEHMDNT